jgi:hypothetical protein
MKNKEVAKILMEHPENEFVVSVDPQFIDEYVRVFAEEVIEILHHEKETVVCMDGGLN